ncbi:DUF4955 domain-containing protein [Fulvivirga sp. M361]|uniref:DUF4955 domain-containing protein n=1 Tax=Fulvivirga sp. M361 TaxID=2594266 RepID=UPI00117BD326|nr:DUF4955 domain-containing protein [Fulvivirga sp. M361]TRX60196.1 DUF4955 domain-containing protein [Fulvivirga sp. M361]
MRLLVMIISIVLFQQKVLAQVAPSWVRFQEDRAQGKASVLPDYSYAGYHFSEKPIPDISAWTLFNVTDYGAVTDDGLYDDVGIQAAIDAAEANAGPAVVFFPPGRFMVSADNNVSKWIQISRDSIVLKGSGSGAGGTEIFMDQRRVQNGHWQFRFSPSTTSIVTRARITAPVVRGDFSVTVDASDQLEAGQTIHIYHKSEEFARAHFGALQLSDNWSRLFGSGGGMTVYEPHIITAISGNRVTFKNPVQTDLPELSGTYVIRELTTIREVGVENILFTSNWETYPEDFVHHKDAIHDYGWNALEFENIRNGWIQNCEFRSWSQSINVVQCIGITIQNVMLTGKKGHASVTTRRGFGLLVKDCEDLAGQHHGPGTGYQGVNTVYLRHLMQKDQSVDSHSGQPYVTLIDDVQGGDFDQNGGPHESYPHHGQHFTFWNFRHSSTSSKTYNFWSVDNRNGNTYANPLFIGFQPDTEVNFINEGMNEMEGQIVEPRSLFEAQLELRLSEANTLPSILFSTPGSGNEFEIGSDLQVAASASDPDGMITGVKLYINDELVREDTEAPYLWGEDAMADPLLFNMSAGVYLLKVLATDDDANQVSDSIKVIIGSVPGVSFVSPGRNEIIERGKKFKVEADATDNDGTVSAVSLYLDDELVRMIAAPPYIWGTDPNQDPHLFNLESGMHTLRLEAIDNDGLKAYDTRDILANQFPEVSFLTPANEQGFDFEANVLVKVAASDTDGSIARVDLYVNDKFHREELNPPYEWGVRSDADAVLFDMPEGTYELKAVAYDNRQSSQEETIRITVAPEEVILSINDDINGNEKVTGYPNPFENGFSINRPLSLLSNIQLLTIEGRNLKLPFTMELHDDSTVLFFPSLGEGLYFLSFELDGKTHLLKLMKE